MASDWAELEALPSRPVVLLRPGMTSNWGELEAILKRRWHAAAEQRRAVTLEKQRADERRLASVIQPIKEFLLDSTHWAEVKRGPRDTTLEGYADIPAEVLAAVSSDDVGIIMEVIQRDWRRLYLQEQRDGSLRVTIYCSW